MAYLLFLRGESALDRESFDAARRFNSFF